MKRQRNLAVLISEQQFQIEAGARIYYGGDMCNNSSKGTVGLVWEDCWGKHINIHLDDGRDILGISPANFSNTYSGNGSTRFVKLEAYQAWREEYIAKQQ